MPRLLAGPKRSVTYLEKRGQTVLVRWDDENGIWFIPIEVVEACKPREKRKGEPLDWRLNTVEQYVTNSAKYWCNRFGVKNLEDREEVLQDALARAWQKVGVERSMYFISGVDLMVKNIVIDFNNRAARSIGENVFDIVEESERETSAAVTGHESGIVLLADSEDYEDPVLRAIHRDDPWFLEVAGMRADGWKFGDIAAVMGEDAKDLRRKWYRLARALGEECL